MPPMRGMSPTGIGHLPPNKFVGPNGKPRRAAPPAGPPAPSGPSPRPDLIDIGIKPNHPPVERNSPSLDPPTKDYPQVDLETRNGRPDDPVPYETMYLPRDIDRQEELSNEPTDCPKCYKKFPQKKLHLHMDKCKGHHLFGEDADPRPYLDHVEQQRKKLQKHTPGKVIVEDDYVEPNDFRDHFNRKKKEPSNEDHSPVR